MLSYSLSEKSKTPLYEQLYQLIRDDILENRLKADSILPSKRNLADHLSISVMTVENTYNQLLSEGYIYSKPRRGYFVSEVIEYPVAKQSMGIQSSKDTYKKKNQTGLINEKKPAVYYADFTSNATDPASFPFATWAKIHRRILSEEQSKLMENSPSNGIYELRAAISDYLNAFRGIDVNPNNIIVGAGTETIYPLLIQLLGYDKLYGTEDPGYEKIYKTLISNGIKVEKIPIDDQGIIPSILEEKNIDIVHITPSHHFPTGITMPVNRRYQLLNWAYDNDKPSNARYIIEDDYDSEFRLSGLPIPSLLSTDKNERVIYMNTFTKSLASTIRISYMVLPDHLMKEYYERLSFYSCPVSTFEQLTLARFITEGYYEKHINRMRTTSKKKRDILLKTIKSGPLADVSEIREEQSGLHFIINLRLNIKDKELIQLCKEKSIKIAAVSPHSFMVNYSSIPLERIEKAVNIIASLIGN